MKQQPFREVVVQAERFKTDGTIELLYPLSPPQFVKVWGGNGQSITFGLPLHSVMPYDSGDRLRVTVEKLSDPSRISANTALQQIYELLYVEDGKENPDKQWTTETLEYVAEVLWKVIPRPSKVRRYRPPKV